MEVCVLLSHSVMSDSLQPHGLQHARPPCPSTTPRVYSNSSPSSRWCHPTISSSVVPFSSRLQSFPASGSFSASQFFPSGGQSTRVSASASVLPMNIQNCFPLGLTGLISLQSRDSQESSPAPQLESIHSWALSLLYGPTFTALIVLFSCVSLTVRSMGSQGEGNGNPLQCSCLENPRDGGAWWAAIYGVAQSQRQLNTWAIVAMISIFSISIFSDTSWPSVFFIEMSVWVFCFILNAN